MSPVVVISNDSMALGKGFGPSAQVEHNAPIKPIVLERAADGSAKPPPNAAIAAAMHKARAEERARTELVQAEAFKRATAHRLKATIAKKRSEEAKQTGDDAAKKKAAAA